MTAESVIVIGAGIVGAATARALQRAGHAVTLVDSGELAGIHLEGPFLSYGKRGAHPPDLLRDPDPASVERLLTAADGRLSMITIAPERQGGLDAIARFAAAGSNCRFNTLTATGRSWSESVVHRNFRADWAARPCARMSLATVLTQHVAPRATNSACSRGLP